MSCVLLGWSFEQRKEKKIKGKVGVHPYIYTRDELLFKIFGQVNTDVKEDDNVFHSCEYFSSLHSLTLKLILLHNFPAHLLIRFD